jgi:dihydropteroate synthase
MFTLNSKGRLLLLDRPFIMGILNRTPDSFYAGSRVREDDALLEQADRMIREGADWLDIGGQSTRPGAGIIGVEEELRRVVDAVDLVHRRWPEIPVSIDSWHARVAREAVDAGAAIVNDISGGRLDPEMLPTVGRLNVPYICMHMKGDPTTMRAEAVYENVVREVLDYFIRRVEECRQAGIRDILLDPGFGFAKTADHNWEIMRQLNVFRMLGRPLMLGVSRKSSIYCPLGLTPEEALNGTTVAHTIGLLNGADILRVHDVRAAKEAITLVRLYKEKGA